MRVADDSAPRVCRSASNGRHHISDVFLASRNALAHGSGIRRRLEARYALSDVKSPRDQGDAIRVPVHVNVFQHGLAKMDESGCV